MKFIDLDFETRSKTKITLGAWKYSECPSTEILWAKFEINGRMYEWKIGDKPPKRLFRAVKRGYIIRAFNSFFEFCIWVNVATPKLGWPKVTIEQFYCVQALAQSKTFKGSLEDAGIDMGLNVTKDKEGKRLINKFSAPSRKKDQEWNEPYDPANVPDFMRFGDYCETDVDVQIGIADFTGLLSEFEYRVFMMTERMNAIGIPIDVDMANGALALVDRAVSAANKEFQTLSGTTLNLSQKQAVKDWLEEDGLPMPNMQAGTIDKKLKDKKISDDHKRILYLIKSAGKTSTSKYKKAVEIVGKDGFIHGILKYHRARTGRWGGAGIQPQNFARPTLPKWTDYEYLAELIADEDYEAIEQLFDDVMEALSSALRSMICATPGNKLIAADYAQIEARVAFWYADEQDPLDLFNKEAELLKAGKIEEAEWFKKEGGGDIYKVMASDIYSKPVSKITDDERFMGKQCILGLGFQMGAPKFKKTLYDTYGVIITNQFATETVNAYRKKYPKIKKIWSQLNEAAINAVTNKGHAFKVSKQNIIYKYEDQYLTCRLPSGRKLHYFQPEVKVIPSPWQKNEVMDQLTFMGIDSFSNKWKRLTTYGGSLFENVVQATARDLMCYGMLNAEDNGYQSLFTVHDEAITMVPDEPKYTYQEYEQLLAATPNWAKGIPVVAEGWEGKRYRK